jgi:hypothetical protein
MDRGGALLSLPLLFSFGAPPPPPLLKIQVYEVKIIGGCFYGYHPIMPLVTILYILSNTT